MSGTTIKLFLVEGSSTGLRVGEISNWSGVAVAGPRKNLDLLLARPEMAGAGVYFLVGHHPESDQNLVYVGEAEILRDRLRQQTKRESWIQAIAFTSKDENLSKGHVRYLEGRVLELARNAGRAVIENSNASGARLPESDISDMEVFLQRVQQLLPILGTDVLLPKSKPRTGVSQQTGRLRCTIKGLTAWGDLTDTGFVVYKGSQAVIGDRPSATPNILALRQRLRQSGVFVERDGYYEFSRDEEFGSPSYAAAAVRGGNSSGPVLWRDDSGRSLKEIEEAASPTSPS